MNNIQRNWIAGGAQSVLISNLFCSMKLISYFFLAKTLEERSLKLSLRFDHCWKVDTSTALFGQADQCSEVDLVYIMRAKSSHQRFGEWSHKR